MPKLQILHSSKQATDRPNRAGAAMILMLLMLVIVLGMVAFAVDLGLMVLLRTEVQHAVDSGALAASLKLQDDPEEIAEAEEVARQFVRYNRVGTTALVPADAIDVVHGVFDSDTNSFTPTDDSPNAVRVFARQDSQPFFFAKIFGQFTFGAPASAIATGAATPLDVMMVLDLSGSMAQEGRIQALWNAAPVFVDVIERLGDNDQIGVMGLAADPSSYDPGASGHSGTLYSSGLHPSSDYRVGVLESPLTTDFVYLRYTVLSSTNLEAGKYQGWTGTGAALGDAVHSLMYGANARQDTEKVIVLMSDGYANKPSGNGPGYARTMAGYAAGQDVTVYTISLGSGADIDLMQDIADLTAGEHFDATGAGSGSLSQQLTEAFQQAAAAIKRVQLVK